LIVLLAIIVIFVAVSVQSTRVASTPTVQGVFWKVNGEEVTTARVGDEVEAHVLIKATHEYVGSITMKVRKDVPFWFDTDYSTKTVPVSLAADEVVELELQFVPDQASGGRLRGYFIEVSFLATHTSWTLENSYPPRLSVND
jgi:hypothetical protein